jgi:hypothetical protein
LEDRAKRVYVDRSVQVDARAREQTVEFDAPPGVYKVTASMTRPECSASKFVYFLQGYGRHIAMTLRAGHSAEHPLYLLAGSLPPELPYMHPVPAVLGSSAQCDYPVSGATTPDGSSEYDPGSYYLSVMGASGVAAGAQTLTLDVEVPAGVVHYFYVPMPFPIPAQSDGWPATVRLDIPLRMVAGLDSRTASWMLCPPWRISSAR